MISKLPYDAVRDFAPVSLVVNLGYVLLVKSDLAVRSLPELIALAKAEPGKLNFSSSGDGVGNHRCAGQDQPSGDRDKDLKMFSVKRSPFGSAMVKEATGAAFGGSATSTVTASPFTRKVCCAMGAAPQ